MATLAKDLLSPSSVKKNNASKGGQCFLERQEFAAYQKHRLVQVVTKTNAEWATSRDLSAYLKQEKQEAMSLGEPLGRSAVNKVTNITSSRQYIMLHTMASRCQLSSAKFIGLIIAKNWSMKPHLSSRSAAANADLRVRRRCEIILRSS